MVIASDTSTTDFLLQVMKTLKQDILMDQKSEVDERFRVCFSHDSSWIRSLVFERFCGERVLGKK